MFAPDLLDKHPGGLYVLCLAFDRTCKADGSMQFCRQRHTAETFFSMAGHASDCLMMKGGLQTQASQIVRCARLWHTHAALLYSCP